MATLCNIYKFYHETHKNVAAMCSKIESIQLCCKLQQHFFTIFSCATRKKNLWDTVQFFHAHATQQIALLRTKKLHRGALPLKTWKIKL